MIAASRIRNRKLVTTPDRGVGLTPAGYAFIRSKPAPYQAFANPIREALAAFHRLSADDQARAAVDLTILAVDCAAAAGVKEIS